MLSQYNMQVGLPLKTTWQAIFVYIKIDVNNIELIIIRNRDKGNSSILLKKKKKKKKHHCGNKGDLSKICTKLVELL
jgi:hypothetical protein